MAKPKPAKKQTKSASLSLQWQSERKLIIILGAVGAVRPLVHDLPALAGKEPLQGIVAMSCFAAMLLVPLILRVPNAFRTILLVGVAYGVFSAIIHQIMWNTVFEGGYPALGADATVHPPVIVLRTIAAAASIITGALTGLLLAVPGHILAPIFKNLGK